MTTDHQLQDWIGRIARPVIREVLQDELADLIPAIISRLSNSSISDDDQFIGVQDAASFLNIKRQTVYQNIDKIPHEKRHGRLYFTRRRLRNYLNQSTE